MKFFLSFLTLALLVGCRKEPHEIAYYKFRGADYEKLTPYSKGQILIFKNENGVEQKYIVSEVSTDFKQWHTVGMGFFTTYAASYYYYDQKEIEIQTYPYSSNPMNIVLRRWPDDEESAKANLYKEFPSTFSGFVSFPFWNAKAGYSSIILEYNSNKVQMVISGKTYEDVLVINSNNNTPLKPDYLKYIQDVNVLYFDAKKGLIG